MNSVNGGSRQSAAVVCQVSLLASVSTPGPRRDRPPRPPAAMGRYGTLVLKVEGVTHGELPKTDVAGDPDPFVRLSFGADSMVWTKPSMGHELEDGNKPQWNETMELALPQERTALHVEIHDHDALERG